MDAVVIIISSESLFIDSAYIVILKDYFHQVHTFFMQNVSITSSYKFHTQSFHYIKLAYKGFAMYSMMVDIFFGY